MTTEMTRVVIADDTARELINLLTPEERAVALVKAGEAKHRTLDKKLMTLHLQRIVKGELQPLTHHEHGTYWGVGETLYVRNSTEKYIGLGRVPGHDGIHVLRNAEGRIVFDTTLNVSPDPYEWQKQWDRLGDDE